MRMIRQLTQKKAIVTSQLMCPAVSMPETDKLTAPAVLGLNFKGSPV